MVSALIPEGENTWLALANKRVYKRCYNHEHHNVCNWMVPVEDTQALCESCRLTDAIPNLSNKRNLPLWFRMEQAKRHLLYTLKKLNLPIMGKSQSSAGLAFRFLEDIKEDEFGQELTVKSRVITGHSEGVITLNLEEAEDASRIAIRQQLNENYRTLVGHFRHESGHYYWDLLINSKQLLEDFRRLFGDERQDYTQALQHYYANGPQPDWYTHCISAYASMHPWEDWAETWAHYLHIVDTLETANEYNVSVRGDSLTNPLTDDSPVDSDHAERSFRVLLADWYNLTTTLNALNRSMGMDDAYPFVIPENAMDKLHFIHNLVRKSTQINCLSPTQNAATD